MVIQKTFTIVETGELLVIFLNHRFNGLIHEDGGPDSLLEINLQSRVYPGMC